MTFFIDNTALVDIINKTASRDVTVMVFVRRLLLACLQFNILFRARHVVGATNVLADYRFRSSNLPRPTVIPSHLLPYNWPLLPRS